jgi:hypothetical protein
VVGVALAELAVELGDLAFEVVDQLHARRDVAAPGLGDLESRKQLSALDSEQVGDRTGLCEVDQRRVDPVLERRLVLDQ